MNCGWLFDMYYVIFFCTLLLSFSMCNVLSSAVFIIFSVAGYRLLEERRLEESSRCFQEAMDWFLDRVTRIPVAKVFFLLFLLCLSCALQFSVLLFFDVSELLISHQRNLLQLKQPAQIFGVNMDTLQIVSLNSRLTLIRVLRCLMI